jgi:hypothetical protein
MAPVVVVKVRDTTKFERWYWPECVPNWLFPPTTQQPAASDGLTPYLGYFFTLNDASGNWLASIALVPGDKNAQLTKSAGKQERRLDATSGVCHELPPAG